MWSPCFYILEVISILKMIFLIFIHIQHFKLKNNKTLIFLCVKIFKCCQSVNQIESERLLTSLYSHRQRGNQIDPNAVLFDFFNHQQESNAYHGTWSYTTMVHTRYILTMYLDRVWTWIVEAQVGESCSESENFF